MGKYLIADAVWEFNFPEEFNKSNFEAFKTDELESAIHKISFEFVEKIEKLKETNHEELGLKMYVEDGIKLFDILDQHKKAIVRGKYIETKNSSTYQILKGEDINLINMLSFMRLAEVISSKSVIAINAYALSMADKALIAIHENVDLFVNKWLEEIDNKALISNNKLFLKIENNLVKVYSNPWSKNQDISNVTLPLHSIIVLSKGKKDKFEELEEKEKLLTLALHLGIMTDTLSNEELMRFCMEIADLVNIFKYQGEINIKEIFNKIYFN